jgi:hypothetical protein
MTNEVVTTLNDISKVAYGLLGSGAVVITIIGCIAVGYLCKALPFVPNKFIPAIVWLTGGASMLVMESTSVVSVRNPKFAIAIVGVGIGIVSWIIHRTLLKKFIDDRWLKAEGDTEITEKK